MEEQQQQDFEKLQKERDEYLEGWKRAKADFVNYKKDELARVESILKLSNEQLIRDLLPVLDSFDLALTALQSRINADETQTHMEKDQQTSVSHPSEALRGGGSSQHESVSWERGVYLIRSQFEDVLKKYGLERIAVTIGEQFNPVIHDAVASVESEHLPGSVIEEVERGYKLGNKVIRAVRVKVSK